MDEFQKWLTAGLIKTQIRSNQETIRNWRDDADLSALVEENGNDPETIPELLADLLFAVNTGKEAITELKHLLKQEIEYKDMEWRTDKVIVIQHSDGTYYAKSDGSGYPSRTEKVIDAADFSWGDHGSIHRNYMETGDTLIEYERTIAMKPTGRTGKEAFE